MLNVKIVLKKFFLELFVKIGGEYYDVLYKSNFIKKKIYIKIFLGFI
jgi:hypothetical protein